MFKPFCFKLYSSIKLFAGDFTAHKRERNNKRRKMTLAQEGPNSIPSHFQFRKTVRSEFKPNTFFFLSYDSFSSLLSSERHVIEFIMSVVYHSDTLVRDYIHACGVSANFGTRHRVLVDCSVEHNL